MELIRRVVSTLTSYALFISKEMKLRDCAVCVIIFTMGMLILALFRCQRPPDSLRRELGVSDSSNYCDMDYISIKLEIVACVVHESDIDLPSLTPMSPLPRHE